jgi:LytR cell envelope-related transcriptional attenuator
VPAVDFPFTHPTPATFPWRTAALVAAAVAALELIVLVAVAGSALLTDAGSPGKTATKATTPAGASKQSAAKAHATTTAAAAAMLPRRKVSLVILNGNGRSGAAAAAATKAQRRGYRIRLVGNAPRQDYPSSLVMYRPGFRPEARRLGRDMGIRMVMPLDGIRPSGLHGAHTIVILGG